MTYPCISTTLGEADAKSSCLATTLAAAEGSSSFWVDRLLKRELLIRAQQGPKDTAETKRDDPGRRV